MRRSALRDFAGCDESHLSTVTRGLTRGNPVRYAPDFWADWRERVRPIGGRSLVRSSPSDMMWIVTDAHLDVANPDQVVDGSGVGESAALAHARSWWLEYCREVVDAGDRHRYGCVQLGGSQDPAFPSDIRWPGYFGPGYRPGGMMIAANIHSDFDEGLGRQAAAAAADVVRDWAAGRISDDDYLLRTGAVYQRGLEAWRVGASTGRPMRYLNIPWTDVVYVNGARCQTFDTGVKLQNLCQLRWPLSQMAANLRPRILVVSSSTVLSHPQNTPWPAGCTVIGVHQRRGAQILPASPWQPPDGLRNFNDWSKYLPGLWQRKGA